MANYALKIRERHIILRSDLFGGLPPLLSARERCQPVGEHLRGCRAVLGVRRCRRAARAERQLPEARALLGPGRAAQDQARQHRVLRRQQQHLRSRARARGRETLRAVRGFQGSAAPRRTRRDSIASCADSSSTYARGQQRARARASDPTCW